MKAICRLASDCDLDFYQSAPYWVCRGCLLEEEEGQDFLTDQYKEAVAHVEQHRDAGHKVPEDTKVPKQARRYSEHNVRASPYITYVLHTTTNV